MDTANSFGPADVLIRVQQTPNPTAIKFITNFPFINEGKATFHHPADAPNLTLVSSLFNIKDVKQVYLFKNTLTITHTGEGDPEEITEQVKSVIQTRLPIHDPNFEEPNKGAQQQKDRSSRVNNEDPFVNEIEEILDRTIRPGLQADGGDIEVIELEGDTLKILYQGACGGCPSAMMGTLDAIQNILRHELDREDLQVVPI